MENITLKKHEVVAGKKVFIGSRNIDEPETWDEFLSMIERESANAMADWKSGRRVRIQREIAGSDTKQAKLDKLALEHGFDSFDEMLEAAKAAKSEKSENLDV